MSEGKIFITQFNFFYQLLFINEKLNYEKSNVETYRHFDAKRICYFMR